MNESIPDSTPQKQCIGLCGRTLPATTEYFYASNTKGGLQGKCIECAKARMAFLREHPIAKTPEGYKHCTRCDRDLLADSDHFGSDKRKKDGFRQPCKECLVEVRKQDREENHEKHLEKDKKRRESHKEQIKVNNTKYVRSARGMEKNRKRQKKYYQENPSVRERIRQYRQANREMYRAISRRFYRNHPEDSRRRGIEFRKANPGKVRMYRANRRARKKSIQGTHTPAQIQEQLKRQKYRCYYAACGHAKFQKRGGKHVYHVEHTFPISRVVGTDIPANDMSYLVLSCPTCNMSKRDKFPWEWPEGGRLI